MLVFSAMHIKKIPLLLIIVVYQLALIALAADTQELLYFF